MAFSGLPSDSTPVALTGVLFSLALDGVGEIGYFTNVSGISVDITPVEYNATRDGSSYLKTMRPGGKRRIIVPPELGPPVGPATFFSSKQWEVFDIELKEVKSCSRSSFGMVSSVVCE